MKKATISLARLSEGFEELAADASHHVLAIWAKACAARVLHFFEAECPDDRRPHHALDALQEWIDTRRFSMATIRAASLGSHAAARDVGADNPARSAARACGQAVATAHVRTHAPGAAAYALQATLRNTTPENVEKAIEAERSWQRQHLILLKTSDPSLQR